MEKVFTVSIIGTGSRGADTYGKFMLESPEKFAIVSLCDINKGKLERARIMLGVKESACFTDEDEFFKEKRSDILVIATLDSDHVRMAKKAIPLGYTILLEKPISANYKECEELLALQKQYGNLIMVCHVLRYTASVKKIKEVLDSGVLGEIVAIDHLERVAYWHFAHSYVRGNWHKEADTAPSILAKCCHDLDLMQYYTGSKCDYISSVGDLKYFKRENQPEGAADRCLQCQYKDSCEYSAKRMYLDWAKNVNYKDAWPYNVITSEPLSEQSLTKALETTDYGKCVYACDNDVADNQHVVMQFANGTKVYLTMMAFTYGGGRRTSFYGTKGELFFDESQNILKVILYNDNITEYKLTDIAKDLRGHGGGDVNMVHALYDKLTNENSVVETSLEASVESHKLAYFAEVSRKNGGKMIDLKNNE